LSDDFERNIHCLLGLPFDAVDLAGAVSRIRDAATRRQSCFFSTPNLNFIVACLTDDAFRNSVIQSDLSIADGTPLVCVAKLLRVPIRERVAGSGVFEILRGENRSRISVYFFGGMEGVAESACKRLNSNPSGVVCVGYEFPGFGSVEDMSSDETIARINASGADFVVVSLGASKGQAWIARNRNRLSAPVISHLGAVMNFVAGTASRAPSWVQRSGMEWLWRVKEEPRLWNRYVADGLVFLRLLVTHVVPHSWLICCHRPTIQELEKAEVKLLEHGAEIVIRLRGAWVLENLRPLRECFSRPALAGRDVRLEMEHVTYVDSAFIGLLMLLYGGRKRQDKRFSVGNPKERVRRIFRYSCAEFLLDRR
jgi:N-acetylglucosaminyldiphosphoundecaprenol N-acetyl-beta-D-mannosaminyltransferase